MIASIAEFLALKGPDAPRQVERDLIAACRAGRSLDLGDLPPEWTDDTPPDPTRHIRADLLRLLITGGTEACGLHPKGIWLEGAQISGALDLSYAKAYGGVVLVACRFAKEPQLAQADLKQLNLHGSHLPGLFAQGIRVEVSVFLRGLTSTDVVDLNGAKIGGQLACEGATVNGTGGLALHAQGVEIGGHLILRNFAATGTVYLLGAKIFGQLACEGATLDGSGGDALMAQRMQVKEGFFFCDLLSVTGPIDLNAAHVGDLVDDAASWPSGTDHLYLNGFTYDRIGGQSPQTFAARKDWLSRGSRFKGDFYPQPYTQFARVLREAGHENESRLVLRERERLLAADRLPRDRKAYRAALEGDQTQRADAGPIWLRMRGAQLWSWATGTFAGYGYAPGLALLWSLGICFAATIVYAMAWDFGLMVPNSAIILTSPDWATAFAKDPIAPALHWTGQAAAHYETFYAIPYALDVYLPVVDLGQHSAWTQTTTTTWGAVIRAFTWALQASGYIVTGLGLAAAAGFIQRGKD